MLCAAYKCSGIFLDGHLSLRRGAEVYIVALPRTGENCAVVLRQCASEVVHALYSIC